LANTNTTVFPQPPYSPGSSRLFVISQTEIHFERTTISDNSRDYGKFAEGATCNPEKGIPGLFPEVATTLVTVHHAEGEYFEGYKARSVVSMSKKIIKKNSFKNF
jgi:hypothetical protein